MRGIMECLRRNVLGIDIGTSSLKFLVTEPLDGGSRIVASVTRSYGLKSHGKQSVSLILKTFFEGLEAIAEELALVTEICVCGQMHGIVWWCSRDLLEAAKRLYRNGCGDHWPWSDLITWEDQRCSEAFLRECNSYCDDECDQLSKLASGYGIASFAHVVKSQPDFMSMYNYDTCGTIMDLMTSLLCGHDTPKQTCIDTMNATSWGPFDSGQMRWNAKFLNALQIPHNVLPRVRKHGDVAGKTVEAFGLPADARVLVGMGDHPCSVVAAAYSPTGRTFLPNVTTVNFGTSGQVALILSETQISAMKTDVSGGFEVRPFFHNQWIGVAASLSGGNVLAWFLAQVNAWKEDLNSEKPITMSELIALGMGRKRTTLTCSPTIFGERFASGLHGSFSNIRADNFGIGDMMAALCRGLVDNLVRMIPQSLRELALSQTIIGTGNGLIRNELLRFYLMGSLTHPDNLQIVDEALEDRFTAVFGATLVTRLEAPTSSV
uniref:Sedoheptulokinase putative n=1 Tax=Albugo laibachii Nc14 TaxID=890382 RepID=F0WU05_9STRA|nr:sedoheptulokinase putative [Albugo laibachii Nc14]|eukprot:CCA24849.1 sedoheptulokinase putative [Albugo laibachii Nc14]